jgi:lipopolysaccharide transport system permease protein
MGLRYTPTTLTGSDLTPIRTRPAHPHIKIIQPRSGANAFKESFRSLYEEFPQAKALAWRFFLRDTRADHRQSILGYLWLVFPALANTLTWVFLNNQNVVNIDSGSVPYPIFVLSGTILWTAFNGSLMGMLGIVGAARGFLAKVNFPQEALIYSAWLKSLLDAFLAALVIIPALFLFKASFYPTMILFPLALLASLILGWAVGLIVIPIATLYNDVSRAIQIVLRFGFFLTPVIFQLPRAGIARRLMLLNPVTPVVVTGRDWLTASGERMVGAFGIVLGISFLVLGIGIILYKVALPHLIERISA